MIDFFLFNEEKPLLNVLIDVSLSNRIEITMVIGNTTSLGARKSSQSTSFLVLTKETPYFEIRWLDVSFLFLKLWADINFTATFIY